MLVKSKEWYERPREWAPIREWAPNLKLRKLDKHTGVYLTHCSIHFWIVQPLLNRNADKLHSLFTGNEFKHMFARVNDANNREKDFLKHLGIHIDSDLSFGHILWFVKASQKLTALLQMVNVLKGKQKKWLIKYFFEAQFNHFPLLWMICSCSLNHRMNRIHKRAFRMAYYYIHPLLKI